jgi:hypothetical protein
MANEVVLAKCGICSKSFYVKTAEIKRGNGKYCSRLCSSKSRVKPIKEPTCTIGNNGCHICTNYGADVDGYPLMNNKLKCGKRITIKVVRFLYERRFGVIEKGLVICHKCDNPSCVNLEHIFIGTQNDNVQDMIKKKRHVYGERSDKAKLTENQVLEIAEMCKNKVRHRQIMEKYKISKRTVSRISCKTTWKITLNKEQNNG